MTNLKDSIGNRAKRFAATLNYDIVCHVSEMRQNYDRWRYDADIMHSTLVLGYCAVVWDYRGSEYWQEGSFLQDTQTRTELQYGAKFGNQDVYQTVKTIAFAWKESMMTYHYRNNHTKNCTESRKRGNKLQKLHESLYGSVIVDFERCNNVFEERRLSAYPTIMGDGTSYLNNGSRSLSRVYW